MSKIEKGTCLGREIMGNFYYLLWTLSSFHNYLVLLFISFLKNFKLQFIVNIIWYSLPCSCHDFIEVIFNGL